MKIGILAIGQIENFSFERLQENLTMIFPKTVFTLIPKAMQIPSGSFDDEKQQYRSDIILNKIRSTMPENKELDRVLGATDVDLYLPPLNFVFGQADVSGKSALISLYRLREEFYKRSAKPELLLERSTKEAVHEIGHTLGLQHCSNHFCVMYFSNSIFDTDRKQSLFCGKCFEKVEATVDNIG
jgi:archaemetzincin